MTAAIATLEVALQTLETNEPINRAEGNIAQADLEAKNAVEIRQALDLLRPSPHIVDAINILQDRIVRWLQLYSRPR